MAGPIIIRKPVFRVAPYSGETIGTPVDLSEDVSAVELSPDVAIDTVSTFVGKFRVADDPEWSATISVVVGDDTATNWAPLIGQKVEAQVFDRGPVATGDKYRAFDTEILLDPSLGGSTDVEERARAYDVDLPVLSEPVWKTMA